MAASQKLPLSSSQLRGSRSSFFSEGGGLAWDFVLFGACWWCTMYNCCVVLFAFWGGMV